MKKTEIDRDLCFNSVWLLLVTAVAAICGGRCLDMLSAAWWDRSRPNLYGHTNVIDLAMTAAMTLGRGTGAVLLLRWIRQHIRARGTQDVRPVEAATSDSVWPPPPQVPEGHDYPSSYGKG